VVFEQRWSNRSTEENLGLALHIKKRKKEGRKKKRRGGRNGVRREGGMRKRGEESCRLVSLEAGDELEAEAQGSSRKQE
jgi:hypothetical protein